MPILNITFQQIAVRIVGLLIIAAIHGFAVAGTARLLGDKGPQHDGRLTLNPFAHVDIIGGIGVVFFSLGWIKPIAADPAAMKAGRVGLVLMALAGAIATLGSTLIFLWVLRPIVATNLSDIASLDVTALIEVTAELGVWFAIFNLVPVPPMTGGHILAAVWPPSAAYFARYRWIVIGAVAVLIVSGLPQQALIPIYQSIAGQVLQGLIQN